MPPELNRVFDREALFFRVRNAPEAMEKDSQVHSHMGTKYQRRLRSTWLCTVPKLDDCVSCSSSLHRHPKDGPSTCSDRKPWLDLSYLLPRLRSLGIHGQVDGQNASQPAIKHKWVRIRSRYLAQHGSPGRLGRVQPHVYRSQVLQPIHGLTAVAPAGHGGDCLGAHFRLRLPAYGKTHRYVQIPNMVDNRQTLGYGETVQRLDVVDHKGELTVYRGTGLDIPAKNLDSELEMFF